MPVTTLLEWPNETGRWLCASVAFSSCLASPPLVSNHYQTKVMGQVGLRVAVLAPEKDSPEWKEKQRVRMLADRWFWIGLVVTAIGVVVQTVGSVWPNQ